MQVWSMVVSIASGCLTLVALVTIFVKLGKEKGASEEIRKEMRKDIDENKRDINNLGQKVSSMQLESVKLITTLSSDLGWIKSSLSDIKTEMSKRGNENGSNK